MLAMIERRRAGDGGAKPSASSTDHSSRCQTGIAFAPRGDRPLGRLFRGDVASFMTGDSATVSADSVIR